MKNKILAGILTLGIVLGNQALIVSASPVEEIPSGEIDTVYEQTVDSNEIEGWPQGPQIYSESGIVMDMDSGAILYAKNIHAPHYPASITKIATALIALQHYEMDEIVTFEQEDVDILRYDYAHIGIRPGEQVLMEDCMYGMLLASANEVSHAIGAHMEGGYEEFLRVMNETAKELGCTDSNFVNTNGLHDENHYTSAYDMALIGAELYEFEKFREITTTHQHTIPETNLVDETRTFQQKHKMLNRNRSQYYEYCTGGKTGYTDESLHTLVTFAEKDDMRLVSVVMRTHGGSNNMYKDTRSILDYGFENFLKIQIAEENMNDERIVAENADVYVTVPRGFSMSQLEYMLEEPSKVGEKTGEISYVYEDMTVGTAQVEITEEHYNEIHEITRKNVEVENEDDEKKPIEKNVILWISLIIIILVFVGFFIYRGRKIRKKRRMRRRLMKQRRKNSSI